MLQHIFDQKESIEIKEWRTDNSILKFLSLNLDEKGDLSEKAHDLPDENNDDEKFRFAPGLWMLCLVHLIHIIQKRKLNCFELLIETQKN